MSKMILTKTEHGLRPADALSESSMLRLVKGKSYTFEYKRARNHKFHRLVFGVATIVCENSDRWDNPLLFIKAVELTHGYVDTLVDMNGEVFMIPKSISFENMEEQEFNKLFDCILIEASKVLGIHQEKLRLQLEEVFRDYGI